MPREFKVQTENLKPVFLPCVNCISGKTQHHVLARVREDGSHDQSDNTYQWCSNSDLVQCGGCLQISYRIVESNSEDYFVDDESGQQHFVETETLYPPRVEGRQSLGDDVWCLPTNIKGVYDEVLTATANKSPVLAGIGLRALVEAVCREKQAQGRDLKTQIKWLEENKVLTPSGAEILHHIRNLGNGAAHETKPHSKEELQLALEVVEHLFMEVFILPYKTKRIFEGRRGLLPQPIVAQPLDAARP